MDGWEFLKRPARAKEEKKPANTIIATVVFGGTEKKFVLDENSTFESIYEDYEHRFGCEFFLEKQKMHVSKYSKIKSILYKDMAEKSAEKQLEQTQTLVLIMNLKPTEQIFASDTELSQTKTATTYTVRYNRYATFLVEKTEENTVDELHQTIISLLPQKENKTIANTFLSFDGDTLNGSDKIDTVLIDKDLIDLMDQNT
ncbi:hypothetical protein NECID01_0686 [Nematocida sp. AWRm77]|nr:hypothetical protein NECID01_0686 [Nematocida sp. AWRm77]